MNKPKKPEVVVEVEPEIRFDVEIQAEPPQLSAREELVATLHPMNPDMLTREEFLTGWTNVAEGGTSTPFIVMAVTPITVTAGVMQQLVSTPGVQVMTIPVTILLTSPAEATPITLQSQFWVEGHQPEGEVHEIVVEVELNQEQPGTQGEKTQEKSDALEDSQEEESTEAGGTQEESSEEDSENPPSEKKKDDSCSTLTTEEDSKAEQRPEPVNSLDQYHLL